MKKKTLLEEINRIHELTYGKQIVNEQEGKSWLSRIFGGDNTQKPNPNNKVDDPKKADLVSEDLAAFYKNLEDAIKAGGLNQQQSGLTFQKGVESMQIGLMALGYELPKHGVDGLFGPETADAVTKFTTEKVGATPTEGAPKPINEAVKLVSQGGGIIGRPGQGTHNVRDWQSRNAWDITGPAGTEVYSLTNGVVDRVKKGGSGIRTTSDGKRIYGDQLSIKTSDGKPDVFYTHIETSLNVGDSVKEGDVVGKIMQGDSGMDTHVHVGLSSGNLSDVATGINGNANGGNNGGPAVKATPEMLTKLIELLKAKPLTSEELKKYIDAAILTGGGAGFTDLDLSTDEGFTAYAQICQKFIDKKQPNPLEITGVMMATSAKNAFTNYHKYVPPELALAQMAAEGGIGNGNLQSRPIRTRNPFNVGNVDSGANVQHGDVQSGIDAYYNLIARNYLVKGKTAADLVRNFVNKDNQRYASGTEYETAVANLAGQANRIAAPIYASLAKKPGVPGGQDTSNIA